MDVQSNFFTGVEEDARYSVPVYNQIWWMNTNQPSNFFHIFPIFTDQSFNQNACTSSTSSPMWPVSWSNRLLTWCPVHGHVAEVGPFDNLDRQPSCRAVVSKTNEQLWHSTVLHGLSWWGTVTAWQTRHIKLGVAMLQWQGMGSVHISSK